MNMKEYGFGVDVGGTTCKLGFFKTDGTLLDKWEIVTDTSNNGANILKDITDAELTTFVELSDECGVKKFWGDIKVTEIDRLMFDNTICIDYEQTRIRDGEKATSTMFFNYNELSYHVAHHYPYERTSDCHSVCERTQMFLWLLEQDFNILEMLTHAPVDPKGSMSYFTCGYVVGDRHTDWFNFENAKYFGVDNKNDAKEYIEKEKTKGRRHRLYRLIDERLKNEEDISSKMKVITLCGSTRFKDQFLEQQKRLTLEGNVVISVGLFGHSGDEEVWKPGMKEMLDKMHLQKIDMADEIFVINVGGYIGESTRREIAHAEQMGRPVRYLECV